MPKYISVSDFCNEVDKGELLVGDNAAWAKEIAYKLPAAFVAPVRNGHWKRVKWHSEKSVNDSVECGFWIVRCSACKLTNETESNYCPNCGARMTPNG